MRIEELLTRIANQFADYLPNLAAGLLLVGIGIVAAWFTKRLVVQVLVILRLHRLLTSFRWAKGLMRTDVRLSLYGLFGNLCGFVVFLVFLNAALAAMRLQAVSDLVANVVLVFPRVLAALAIFAIGWLISSWASMAVRRTLYRENVPRANLIASYGRAMMVLFFASMALAELNVSRDVVLIGFSVIFLTLAAVAVVAVSQAGKNVWRRVAQARASDDKEQA